MRCWISLEFAPAEADERRRLAERIAAGAVAFESATGWYSTLTEPLRETMRSAAHDTTNGARVNNCAVALFLTGIGDPNASESDAVTNEEDAATFTVDDIAFADSETLQRSAVEILTAAVEVFDDRELTLNLGFLQDLLRDYAGSTEILRGYVHSHPDDVGARLLLASIQGRGITPDWDPQPAGLTDALATLAPLRKLPKYDGLRLIAEGDAYIGAADRWVGASPFVVRDLAFRALDRYDEAVALGHPAGYAGRAAALDLLGFPGAAQESLEAFVSTVGPTAVLQTHRAALARCDGDQAERLTSSISALVPAAPLTLTSLRLTPGNGISRDRGYRGSSIGSEAGAKDVPLLGQEIRSSSSLATEILRPGPASTRSLASMRSLRTPSRQRSQPKIATASKMRVSR